MSDPYTDVNYLEYLAGLQRDQRRAQMTHTDSAYQVSPDLEYLTEPFSTMDRGPSDMGDRLLSIREGAGALPGNTARLLSDVTRNPMQFSPLGPVISMTPIEDMMGQSPVSQMFEQAAGAADRAYMSNPGYYDPARQVFPTTLDEDIGYWGAQVALDPLNAAPVGKAGPTVRRSVDATLDALQELAMTPSPMRAQGGARLQPFTPGGSVAPESREGLTEALGMKAEQFFDPNGVDYDQIHRATGWWVKGPPTRTRPAPRDGSAPMGDAPLLKGQLGAVGVKPESPVPGMISTRYPTAKTATEDASTNHNLLVGLDSAMQDPAAFIHNSKLLKKTAPLPSRSRRADKVTEEYIDFGQNNLDFIYNQVDPDIRARSMKWYDGANKISTEKAAEYNLPPEATAGVYAALSPQKDWFMNVSLGDRVIDIYHNQPNTPWGAVQNAKLDELSVRATNDAFRRVAEAIRGKRLDQLEDPVEKALWIRTWDEANNDGSFDIILPEGGKAGKVTRKDGENSTAAWGSLKEIATAVGVLDNPDLANISRLMGGQHKVRSFYNNIYAPNSPRGDATIDTHAVAAQYLQPFAGADEAVSHNFGGGLLGEVGPKNNARLGTQGTYGVNQEVYRRAAEDKSLLPRQMQSITWEAVRGLFNNKSAGQKATAKRIWDEYKRGKITQGKAQELILDAAGGINEPAWAR